MTAARMLWLLNDVERQADTRVILERQDHGILLE